MYICNHSLNVDIYLTALQSHCNRQQTEHDKVQAHTVISGFPLVLKKATHIRLSQQVHTNKTLHRTVRF
jgi:hypothetical protein